MFHLPIEDILKLLEEDNSYFFPTIILPFYREAVLIYGREELISYNTMNTKYKLNESLKTVWNFDIIRVYDESEIYNERYYCGYFRGYNMADQKIVNISDEYCDYSDDSLFNINSWGADLSFRELIMMYDEDELLKPELQRKYVWSKDEASKFVDSLLLGLPVPSVFLAKVGEQKLIIDGYQRLMTVYDFVRGIFSGDGKVFKLTNSEAINHRWRGKAFAELSKDEQRRIQSTTIHAIIFEQKHPANDSGMYKIFERINTGGRTLKPQEIRNCVYHGAFNTTLTTLNEYSAWRNAWGSAISDSRMADIEFVLRFFALDTLLLTGTDLKRVSLKKELNSFMANKANITEVELAKLVEEFQKVIDIIWTALGNKAFRNLTKSTDKSKEQKFSKAIHPAIFDAVSIATAQIIREEKFEAIKNFTVESYKHLLNNDEFYDCITVRTTDVEKIKRRVQLAYNYLFGVQDET